MFSNSFTHLIVNVANQSDRITGMARWINTQNQNSQYIDLALIFSGAVVLILLLRTISKRQAAEAKARKLVIAKRKAAAEKERNHKNAMAKKKPNKSLHNRRKAF